MPSNLIESATRFRPRMVFLPPALISYISYLHQDFLMIALSGVFVAISAAVHDLAVAGKEHSGESNIRYKIDGPDWVQSLLFISLLYYVLGALITPVVALQEFYNTTNFYIGIGLFLYIIMAVKLLRPFERYRDSEGED